MNSDFQALYQEVILDHNKRPRNFRIIDPSTSMARGHNPLCGDQIQVYVMIQNNIVIDVSFQGQGCAISTASASLMTEIVKNKTLEDIQLIFEAFHNTVTKDEAGNEDILGRLNILTGVKNFPSRVKCATLAWHALQAAIHKKTDAIKTE